MAFESRFADQAGSIQPGGLISIIRCEPDPFTGERLNVGVIGVDSAGRRLVKVIEEPGRLECLYGDSATSVVWLARAAEEAATLGLDPPSPQVHFDAPTAFFNESLEEAVARAFDDLVTVALPLPERRRLRKQLSDEAALSAVSDAVKGLIGLNFELLANSPNVLLQTDRGPWTVRVPLQPRNGVGTVRSADYTPHVLRAHLTDSILDLDCAARYRQKRSMGLFLLRPLGDVEAQDEAIDAVIDSVVHRAPKSMRFEVADTAEGLAAAVHQWGVEASQ